MNDASPTTSTTTSSTIGKSIEVRPPFTLETESQRRFVRLEISAPVSLASIKDIFGNFVPEEHTYDCHGSILNISEGGVLAELEEPLNEGDIVAMRFVLQGTESLEHVLGLVKRCDPEDGCCLTGIEFIRRDSLTDRLTEAEFDLLDGKISDLENRVSDVLKSYVARTAEGV